MSSARIDRAQEAVNQAIDALAREVASEYPVGRRVLVSWGRGSAWMRVKSINPRQRAEVVAENEWTGHYHNIGVNRILDVER